MRPIPPRARLQLGIGACAALCIAGLIGTAPALSHLGRARASRDAIRVMLAQSPQPQQRLMAREAMLDVASPEQAQTDLRSFVRFTAVREGVLIEQLTDAASVSPAAIVNLSVSGDSTHVLRFAESIENRQPVIRFTTWRIEKAGPAGSIVRLQAKAALIRNGQI